MDNIPPAPAPVLSIIVADLLHVGTPDQLRAMGVNREAIDHAVAKLAYDAAREKLRNRIGYEAGDTQSILGTTTDGAQLAIYAIAKLVAGLAAATTLAEVRATAEPFLPLAQSFLGKLDSGEVKLPFLLKGLEAVVEDIETRATAVANVMIDASKTVADS